METRPALHALVCCFSGLFGICGEAEPDDVIPPPEKWPRVMLLEHAVDFAMGGFAVLVDPQDECDLSTFERAERMKGRTRRIWTP